MLRFKKPLVTDMFPSVLGLPKKLFSLISLFGGVMSSPFSVF